MVKVSLDGAAIDPSLLGTNDGLNYGHFDAPGLEVHQYQFSATAPEIISVLSSSFETLATEMREDDLLDEEPSALRRMGYPTLQEAFRHPAELAEVIEIFLDRDILVHFMPFTARSQLVINSTDRVLVTPSQIAIFGRCFRRRG